jgi:hypothetical protein
LSALSAGLLGTTLIQTANDDKNEASANYLTFTLSAPATVYVAFDSRAPMLPGWLNDGTWQRSSETVGDTATPTQPPVVYAKQLAAGTVTLGGNKAAPLNTTVWPYGGNYFLFAKASVPTPPPPAAAGLVTINSVSTGKAYDTMTAQAGVAYYIDRAYAITSLSANLQGGTLIRTANDDKAVNAANYLTFTLSAPATVYVVYDARATSLPAWLNDGTWQLTSEVFVENAGAPMNVFAKQFGAGTVTLGGNQQAPASFPGSGSNYVVIIKR